MISFDWAKVDFQFLILEIMFSKQMLFEIGVMFGPKYTQTRALSKEPSQHVQKINKR